MRGLDLRPVAGMGTSRGGRKRHPTTMMTSTLDVNPKLALFENPLQMDIFYRGQDIPVDECIRCVHRPPRTKEDDMKEPWIVFRIRATIEAFIDGWMSSTECCPTIRKFAHGLDWAGDEWYCTRVRN